MKNIIFLSTVLLFTGCQKDADLKKISSGHLSHNEYLDPALYKEVFIQTISSGQVTLEFKSNFATMKRFNTAGSVIESTQYSLSKLGGIRFQVQSADGEAEWELDLRGDILNVCVVNGDCETYYASHLL